MIFSSIHSRSLTHLGDKVVVFDTQLDHDNYFRELVLCKLAGENWNSSNRGIRYTIKSRILFEHKLLPAKWTSRITIATSTKLLWECNSGYASSQDAIMAAQDRLLLILKTTNGNKA